MSTANVLPLNNPNSLDCSRYAKGLYIGGKWIAGSGIPVVDPSTEEVLAEVPDASEDQARQAVDAAHAAAPGWRATPPRQRADRILDGMCGGSAGGAESHAGAKGAHHDVGPRIDRAGFAIGALEAAAKQFDGQ